MLIDANLLIYSLAAFVRIMTHPKITTSPIDPTTAAVVVRDWLEVPTVWIPAPGPAHGQLFRDLVERYQLTGNLVNDASLATLALEHGLTLASTDSDFARFTELNWINPITAG